jgi:hypothetical protein
MVSGVVISSWSKQCLCMCVLASATHTAFDIVKVMLAWFLFLLLRFVTPFCHSVFVACNISVPIVRGHAYACSLWWLFVDTGP